MRLLDTLQSDTALGSASGASFHRDFAFTSPGLSATSFRLKNTTALVDPDGIGGDLKVPDFQPLGNAVIDTVPGDTSTTATLTVDAPSIVSTIDTIGDEDFYAVTLVAGRSYEIGMYGFAGGPGGLPLSDAYVELYDAAGNLVVSADGGADTPLNSVNSGFDVLLSFAPQTTGTYYVNARAFDNLALDGDRGDLVGDYEIFARDATDNPGYVPYYETTGPLYAIDWGTQVDGTARNPDGNEGTRVTGNAQGTPVDDAYSITGKNVIKIYFAKAGDVFLPNDATSPGLPPAIVAVGAKDFERDAVWTALHEFEKVADVKYVEVQTREEANFFYVTYSGTPGPGISLLGSMSPPQESDEGLAQFNSGDYRWNATNLQQGGFSFVTLIHEFGHGHGMAHPHDNGGHSGEMNGVVSTGINTPGGTVPDPVGVYPDYSTGDYELNQGVHTMMSYEDGWQSSPYGNAPTDVGYGYLGGLMAFDIAVIQDKYGVNEEWATGNDVYTLKDVNAAGTYYSSIWDGGGTDTIRYVGARDTVIDLRQATLNYEVGGGGFMSYAYGIYGGFTIASGVTIENATSGSGNDVLTGNSANNVLTAGAGDDLLDGGAGADRLDGGAGIDTVTYAGAASAVTATLRYNNGAGAAAGDTFVAIENLTGSAFNDTLTGSDAANALNGGAGDDVIAGMGGNDALDGGAGNDTADFADGAQNVVASLATGTATGQGIDTLSGFENLRGSRGNDLLTGDGNANKLKGETGNDQLDGGGGNDTLEGGAGNDVLIGGAGADLLSGGAGADRFVFLSGDSGTAAGTFDRINDFDRASGDLIDLSGIDAIAGTPLNDAFTFIGTAAFSRHAGELRYEVKGGYTYVHGDTNGDGAADFTIQLASTKPLGIDAFLP